MHLTSLPLERVIVAHPIVREEPLVTRTWPVRYER